MRATPKSLLFFILIIPFFSLHSHAGDQEKDELNRLIHELHYLEGIVERAKKTVSSEEAIRFNYEKLEKDLAFIQQGITDYIHQKRRDPRVLKKIDGDYSLGR